MSQKELAFSRYAPFIQDYIYRHNWSDLREVQIEACSEILDGKNHLIIASGTASGKTEAAFFPILTDLERNPSDSISVLYIGPLKALINDQFKRLDELLESKDIPVWPWHGDIAANMKRKAEKENKGIIQITPESLESLIMRDPSRARKLFKDLRYIVIDEIHALMEQDRGLQVICLINRLEQLIGIRPRRIGLSATISDTLSAERFLGAGSKRPVKTIGLDSQKKSFQVAIQSYPISSNPDEAAKNFRKYYDFLYDNSHLKKCLIFTNSRRAAEETISSLKKISAERKDRDIFYVHHGSLSKELRQETETALKNTIGPTVAAATLTLELGIDIGDLDRIIQIGAPFSCSSFVQRLGRSGRKTGKSQMIFVSRYENSELHLLDKLPWELLISIAILQLYAEENWVEPFNIKKKPYSLLVHQTLSVLYSFNGLKPPELARRVLTLPPFINTISQQEYREILRFMIQEEYLEMMEEGEIIIGVKAENMVNHYTFLSVFDDQQGYQVISKKGSVGFVDNCPALGEVFVLGGASWKVKSIDEEKRKVFVTSFKTNKTPHWTGGGGHIHSKIIKRVQKILSEDKTYSYLQPEAQKLLDESRDYIKSFKALDYNLIPIGEKSFLICPWTGTKEINTLYQLLNNGLKSYLKIRSIVNSRFYLEVTSDLSYKEFKRKCNTLYLDLSDPNLILSKDQAPLVDKYDRMVPGLLLREAYLYNEMDLPAALEILRNLK